MNSQRFLLQHILDESATIYADKTAICAEGRTITYKGMAEKSRRLSELLAMAGVSQGDLVGIYLHKSIETVIAMFAVLKAGGAYIPLDSHYSPIIRINKIIDHSKTEYIITTTEQWRELIEDKAEKQENFPDKKKIILIDRMIQDSAPCDLSDSDKINETSFYIYDSITDYKPVKNIKTVSSDLAYILYTSGSTGVPKGVMISHLNAMTFIKWGLSCFKPNCEDIFSNFAPLHFDLSVFDIFVALASGACVTMVPVSIANNPRAIIDWANSQKVTIWYSVPSVWVSIMNYAQINEDDLRSLRYILFAGEVFPPKYLKELMVKLPGAQYFNLYGPTETNVCTYYYVKNHEEIKDRPVPIGKACENTDILVLNEFNQPAQIGQEGELLVRGTIVTEGYYKEPEKTKDIFVKSPVTYHNGAKFYKTSDIVRVCEDNNYEYIGRKDLMVKRSGFRVELQEIEHAFYQDEKIEEVAVVTHTNHENNNTSLYAFVMVKSGVQFSVIESKKHLSKSIPKYMIPDVIIKVDSIPKNANGKIDRQMLYKSVTNKYA